MPDFQGIAQWFNRLAYPLDATIGASKGTVFFCKGRARQHYVSQLRRLGGENVLYNQELATLQSRAHMIEVGIGHHGVFAQDKERFQVSMMRRFDHLGYR